MTDEKPTRERWRALMRGAATVFDLGSVLFPMPPAIHPEQEESGLSRSASRIRRASERAMHKLQRSIGGQPSHQQA